MDTFIAWSDPLARPLHFLGLELLVVAAFAVTLHDAVGRAQRGERHALFQWLVALFYGVFMELIAFNFLSNYEHGRFTVELYHRKLPLYVVCLYPVFHYTGLKIIERFGLGALREALLAGFAICLIDVPFDVAGVAAHWWRWSSGDPTLAARWLGVPVTSYAWYLIFGAVYAALGRALRARVERRAAWLFIAPVAAVGVIGLGTVAFLPFHGLRALGVPADAIVAAHLTVCAALSTARAPRAASPALVAIPAVLGAFCVGVLFTLASRAELSRAPLAIAAALLSWLGVGFLAWPRRVRRDEMEVS
jgi:hypothetical protein